MTITELLSQRAVPTELAIAVLEKIRDCVPYKGFSKDGSVPVGSYLIPFVDRRGNVVGWVPFAPPNAQKHVYVSIAWHRDPNRVYRVQENGTVETIRNVNEDW
jgi:hypothetical protein